MQATKALPLAPVCVIIPAIEHCPFITTRSAPGEPTPSSKSVSHPITRAKHQGPRTSSISLARRQNRKLIKRLRKTLEAESLVIVVHVRISRASSSAASPDVVAGGVGSGTDGTGAVKDLAAGGSVSLGKLIQRSGAGKGDEGEEAEELHLGWWWWSISREMGGQRLV